MVKTAHCVTYVLFPWESADWVILQGTYLVNPAYEKEFLRLLKSYRQPLVA